MSTNHNLFEEKGEPKRYRTEVIPLTSLTPYRYAKPAHIYATGVATQNFIVRKIPAIFRFLVKYNINKAI